MGYPPRQWRRVHFKSNLGFDHVHGVDTLWSPLGPIGCFFCAQPTIAFSDARGMNLAGRDHPLDAALSVTLSVFGLSQTETKANILRKALP